MPALQFTSPAPVTFYTILDPSMRFTALPATYQTIHMLFDLVVITTKPIKF